MGMVGLIWDCFIATSDGETIHRPKFYVDAQSQRRLGMCVGNGVYFARVQAREIAKLVLLVALIRVKDSGSTGAPLRSLWL